MSVEKKFSISLDVKQPTSNRDIEVVEGDTGNVLVVTLTDNGQAVNLTDCKVCAVFAKPNGKTAMQDTDGNGLTVAGEENNEITIELYNTSFSPGMVTCEVQVFSGEDMGTLITSAQFNFKCRRGIVNEDTIQATDEWPMLVEMMQRVDAAEEELIALNGQTAEAAAMADAATERANEAAEAVQATNAAMEAAEALRETAEQARINNETERDMGEEAREEAELLRELDESIRQTREEAREANTAAAIDAAEAAAERADRAAERAEAAADVFPSHNTTHAIGGSDPITPDMVGAEPAITVGSGAPGKAGHFHIQFSATRLGNVLPSGAGSESILYLKENGTETPFLVLKHDYEGSGRTLVLRKGLYDKRIWSSNGTNDYAASDIDAWLNGEYLALLEDTVQNMIEPVSIPYTPTSGTELLEQARLERRAFLLSDGEACNGMPYSPMLEPSFPPAEGEKIAFFLSQGEIADALDADGISGKWWTRTPCVRKENVFVDPSMVSTTKMYEAVTVATYDTSANIQIGNPIKMVRKIYADLEALEGSRPAFTLPADMPVEVGADGAYRLSDAAEGSGVRTTIWHGHNGAWSVLRRSIDAALTLPASGWEGETAPFTQTLAVDGLTGNRFENPEVLPEYGPENIEAVRAAWSLVDNAVSMEGGLLFICLSEKPEMDIPLIVKVRD